MEKPNVLHPIHNYNDGVFNSHSGLLIDILNPIPQMIELDDIAHALSNICRFGGQADNFYSVAQHSLLVCLIAPLKLKKEALLHDAAEAYIGDVIKPLKVIIGDKYESIQAGFMRAISARFGLNAENLLEVKTYDRIALGLEHEYLLNGNGVPLKNMVDEAKLRYPDFRFAPFEPLFSKPFFKHAYQCYFDRYWDTYPGNLTWDMY